MLMLVKGCCSGTSSSEHSIAASESAQTVWGGDGGGKSGWRIYTFQLCSCACLLSVHNVGAKEYGVVVGFIIGSWAISRHKFSTGNLNPKRGEIYVFVLKWLFFFFLVYNKAWKVKLNVYKLGWRHAEMMPQWVKCSLYTQVWIPSTYVKDRTSCMGLKPSARV